MHREWPVSEIGEGDTKDGEHDIATDNDDHEPPRDHTAYRKPDQRGKNKQAVCRRIEQLTESRDLVQLAGDYPVKKISDTGENEHEQCESIFATHDEHEEYRNEKQPDEAQDVGNRDNAGAHPVALLWFHERSLSTTGVAPGFDTRHLPVVFRSPGDRTVGSVALMSCIRFNTSAQRQAMRDHRPVMLTREETAGRHPAPPVTASKIRRLGVLAADTNPKIRESAASSRHTPIDLFMALAHDRDEGVRACVARNETAPSDVLRSLADDPSDRVRGFLAVNFSAPSDVMRQLADDPSETVRGLVSWRSAFTGS